MESDNIESLEILNRRLANGEITPEEYNNLKITMGVTVLPTPENPSEDTSPLPPEIPPPSGDKKGNNNLKTISMYAFAGFVAFALLKSCFSGGNVRITNLQTSGWFISTVSGTIVNDGSSGDIWIWFEQGGKNICPRTTYMLANSEKNFSFDCYDMKEGNYTARGSKSPPSDVSNSAQGL